MENLLGMATGTFASTTGFSVEQALSYATSSVVHVYVGTILSFLQNDTRYVIAYGMVTLVLLICVRATVFFFK